jgi:alpha-1,6-mannosyltransferase
VLLDLGVIETILEQERPDLIESGDPYQVAWKAIFSGRALGIPAVGFYHSHFPEAYIRSVAKYFGKIAVQIAQDVSQLYVRGLYNRFERTLVPSPGLVELLRTWGVENTEKTDLGVDTTIFRPEPDDRAQTRAEEGVPPDRKLLLYVGRLAQEKNVRTLLEAFRLLHNETPGHFHLLAIGDGALRSSVERLAAATGAVTWHSFCSDPWRLAKLYRAADLFVHPSVQETFGLVTLESQACGTPLVGIRGSYMDRIIFSDQAHWAAENSPAALARAIRAVAESDLPAVGMLAAQDVRDKYSWDVVFDKLFSIYEDVCQKYSS